MSRSFTVAELAEAHGLELRGDGDTVIHGVASLRAAGPEELSFLAFASNRRHLASTRAGAVILSAEAAADCPTTALVCANPHAVFARVAQQLYPVDRPEPGIHPSAVVADGCDLGPGASIGPHAVIDVGCVIGRDVVVGPGCVLGKRVSLGAGSRLVANVTLGDGVLIGARALLQPGAVVGGDGFGFANDGGRWERVPQIGSVVVGDDVEIGANTTVDRGSIEDTVLGDGVKLDNLIMIGHNVRIGDHTAMAACTGVAGSTVIGARCTIGGHSGISGHLEIADDVHITAYSMVISNVASPGVYSSGVPLMGNREWRKNMVRLRQLDNLARRVVALERDSDER
ncbi:MAG: UDP-3-O-(3-hydroxymyristoyl)glucosamine N-acyltransferase [Gammaproteobacteria bacterium]|nr:UDP-3-O-(3-hydroxymyristoyl)glucosamine N-acyltransferase [Gammaproteobacteria bacterium]